MGVPKMANAKASKLQELEAAMQQAKQAYEEALQIEKERAIEQVLRVIAEFGLTAADLNLQPKPTMKDGEKMPNKRAAAKPKYRNPATGELWAGRGLPPAWLKEAERTGISRSQYLIDPKK
jgi:DNA-binding protein H-NS